MQIVCPNKTLSAWVKALPTTFFSSGEVIYNARNQIRVIEGPDGQTYVVKRYRQPAFFNRIVYTFFRTPKAVRAYRNAQVLLERGIDTPQPVAYLMCGSHLIKESYLVTYKAPQSAMLYEWGDGIIEGREETMRAFGRFTAKMHEAGILHLDYSPGNILYDSNNQFTVVDINRLRLGKVSLSTGCANLYRLWGGKAMYRLIAEGYAQVRNADVEQCYQRMFDAHHRYWHHRKLPHTDLQLVME